MANVPVSITDVRLSPSTDNESNVPVLQSQMVLLVFRSNWKIGILYKGLYQTILDSKNSEMEGVPLKGALDYYSI